MRVWMRRINSCIRFDMDCLTHARRDGAHLFESCYAILKINPRAWDGR